MRRQILHISVFSIMIAFTYPLDALSGNGVRQWQKKPDLIECNKTIAVSVFESNAKVCQKKKTHNNFFFIPNVAHGPFLDELFNRRIVN